MEDSVPAIRYELFSQAELQQEIQLPEGNRFFTDLIDGISAFQSVTFEPPTGHHDACADVPLLQVQFATQHSSGFTTLSVPQKINVPCLSG